VTDYTDLHQRLWQLVQEYDQRLSGGAAASARRLIERLKAEGFQVGPEAQAELENYFRQIETALRGGIAAATRLGSPKEMRDELVAQLTEEAFARRWEDGKHLSQRLWNFKSEMKQGLEKVLQDGARMGKSVDALMMDMQRAIEADAGLFGIKHRAWDDWAQELAEAAKPVIKDGSLRKFWQKTASEIWGHIQELKDSGTKHAAETAFRRIVKAVETGQMELLSDAVYWWQYDKQLYYLKRIARTELATAQHRAVIESTLGDPDIIGYQWRLSSSHPEPDICDYYAAIDMGLGKGVWTKDAIPRHKAHPHCMCLIVPRVTPVRQPGSTTYGDFIRGMAPERRGKFLPPWAREAMKQGRSLDSLIRPDGLGLLTRQEAGLG
jgi:hypothetical protein